MPAHEPAHEILVQNALASIESSGKYVQMRWIYIFTRSSSARIHKDQILEI